MKKLNKNRIILTVSIILLAFAVAGCSFLDALSAKIKGELVGNDYTISEYDNFGNLVMTISGDKVNMKEGRDSAGDATSYIDITIDGYEWNHVGSTLVFAQNGVDMITDFAIPSTIETNGDTSHGLIAVDRFVNSYKNLFGKARVVLVSSQTGAPIGLFQGDDCYTEIPSDLPKTTLIHIDGYNVYVHRANVDIFDTGLFESGE